MMLWPQQFSNASLWQWRKKHPVWFAGCCGLLIAILGWVSGGISYGSGYAITARAVAGDLVLPWYAPISRFLATLSSYFSGIPGGIFAPSLAIGAAVGSDLSQLFADQALPLIALCMAGLLAAVTQAPITSAIIVMEMVDDHSLVISLMAVCLLAKAVSSRLGPEHSVDALCERSKHVDIQDRQKI
jgi:H+/Cl- antiporter ClcA